MLVAALAVEATTAAKPEKKKKKQKTEQAVPAPAPAAKKDEAKIPDISTVIKKDAKSYEGLFNVVEQSGTYYLMLPTSELGRDYLMVTRISKSPAGLRSGFTGYAGDDISEEMIRFSLSSDSSKVFLQSIVTSEMPRDTLGDMYENVERSNFQPLIEALSVKGLSKAADTLLVDVTQFMVGDNELSSFSAWDRRALNLAAYQKDRSYISGVKSFPINTEFRTVKTYMHTPSGKLWDGKPYPSRAVSFELNTSIIALPETPMQPRYYDERVGYFTERYVDFDKNPQGVKNMQLITRWRLEPKAEDMEAYMRGELVEPEKPIVFYVDPTTPEKWVDALIQGVNDWEPAFRNAGFKNAIRAERAPVGDSTWSLEDARHSAIVYKPSTIPNASGPHIHDPRTGEILESHINWYHNVMLLLRNWYMIQAGPNNPDAQKMVFDDALMSELIRFVSSHEVGHTLGLRHNFIGSAVTPVDSLRSAEYLEKYGHCTSIMDYSRFNYVVQPEDGVDPVLQFPRINDYDNWAIEWGYRRFDGLDENQEKEKINEWIIEAMKNPRLLFGTEMSANDPRLQSEDLGDNQMEANALGMKNLERVVAGLPEWTATPGEGFADLKTMYLEVISQYSRYVGHVAKWVGGIYETPITIEQGDKIYEYVDKNKQQEAMKWLKEYFFDTQKWIYDQSIFDKTRMSSIDVAERIYMSNMGKIVSSRVISNLIDAEADLGASKVYTVSNYFNDLNSYVFRSSTSANERVKQKVYVQALLNLVPVDGKYSSIKGTDAAAVVIAQLRDIYAKNNNATDGNVTIRAHKQYIADLINDKLNLRK